MNRILPLFRRTLARRLARAPRLDRRLRRRPRHLPARLLVARRERAVRRHDRLPSPELVNTLGYDQIATGAGYVQATFFGLVGFVMISIAAVGWGTGAIANDEETGQLELTLAHGVTRGQLYAERTAAVAVKLAWLGLVAVVMVLVLNGPSDLGVEVGPLFAAAGAFVGLGLLAASASIAVGGISRATQLVTRRRRRRRRVRLHRERARQSDRGPKGCTTTRRSAGRTALTRSPTGGTGASGSSTASPRSSSSSAGSSSAVETSRSEGVERADAAATRRGIRRSCSAVTWWLRQTCHAGNC